MREAARKADAKARDDWLAARAGRMDTITPWPVQYGQRIDLGDANPEVLCDDSVWSLRVPWHAHRVRRYPGLDC